MDDYEFIKTERQDTAMIARLDNPPRNLLNAKMVVELSAFVNAVEADDAIRTLILTGASEGTFILHYDVGELSTASDRAREQAPPPAAGAGELHGMHKLLLAIQDMS